MWGQTHNPFKRGRRGGVEGNGDNWTRAACRLLGLPGRRKACDERAVIVPDLFLSVIWSFPPSPLILPFGVADTDTTVRRVEVSPLPNQPGHCRMGHTTHIASLKPSLESGGGGCRAWRTRTAVSNRYDRLLFAIPYTIRYCGRDSQGQPPADTSREAQESQERRACNHQVTNCYV